MGEGIIARLKDAKSGNARREILDEVGRLAREKHECERKNQELENQISELKGLLEEKDAAIKAQNKKMGYLEGAFSEKDLLAAGLKAQIEEQKEKIEEHKKSLRLVRKDNLKLQKSFRIMKKVAFLPKPKEEED